MPCLYGPARPGSRRDRGVQVERQRLVMQRAICQKVRREGVLPGGLGLRVRARWGRGARPPERGIVREGSQLP